MKKIIEFSCLAFKLNSSVLTVLAMASLLFSANVSAITAVTASGYGGSRVPANTIDGNLTTRWGLKNREAWIKYDLGTTMIVTSIDIDFLKGNKRYAELEIELSMDNQDWTTVFAGSQKELSLDFHNFSFAHRGARYVRIQAKGNSQDANNSYNEVIINTIEPAPYLPRAPIETTVSNNGGWINYNHGTWYSTDTANTFTYDMGKNYAIDELYLSFMNGHLLFPLFSLYLSEDGKDWTLIRSGTSTALSSDLQSIHLNAKAKESAVGRYLRIRGRGAYWNVGSIPPNTYFPGFGINFEDTQIYATEVGSEPENPPSTPTAIPRSILETFESEGESPIVGDALVFDALKEKYESSNGNGWRHEYKVDEDLRKSMEDTVERLKADVKIDLSDGGKTIVTQYHAHDLGTIMKLYVSDTSESAFNSGFVPSNSIAADGIFDVYVRMKTPANNGAEEKFMLGTMRSGQSFTMEVVKMEGLTLTVRAFGKEATMGIVDDSEVYLKFGNYLQAQNPQGSVDCDDIDLDFEDCYDEYDIDKAVVTMTNVEYSRD